MLRRELYRLADGLRSVGALKAGIKFAYAVAKNLDAAEREIALINKTQTPSSEMIEYEKKRIELARKHSAKKDNGEPILAGDQFVLADYAAFDAEFKALQREYWEALEEHETRQQDFEAFLDGEADYRPYMIPLDLVPEDITPGQMRGIFEVIVEPPGEAEE